MDGRERSTLDLYGAGLVLLTGPAGQPWAGAAARLEVPVETHQVPAEAAAVYGLEEDGAALVRPDGFVAWRSPWGVPDPAAALGAAAAAALHRPPDIR